MTISFAGKAFWVGAALAAAAALPAAAQDGTQLDRQNRGFYIGGGAGANFLSDNHYERNGSDSKTKYDPGLAGVLNLGYALGNGLRFELEPGYRYNDVESDAGMHGRLQQFSLMTNAIYDIPIRVPYLPLTPHVGAGIGWARLWDHSGPHGVAGATSGHDDAFAYQAIAGVDYALSPGLKVGLDYRYQVATGVDFKTATGLTSHVGDVENHTALVTFRYEFGTPSAPPRAEPAAAVAPAPQPPARPAVPPTAGPQQYTVFFDFNRAELDPSGVSVVDNAAASAKRGQVSRIMVTGHADTAGSSGYNQRISERRAQAVRAELIRQGVPAGEIVTVGRGESQPAVPTPDGVREPRNRRVEIVLQSAGT